MSLSKRNCQCPWLTWAGNWLTPTLTCTVSFSPSISSSSGVAWLGLRSGGAPEWPCTLANLTILCMWWNVGIMPYCSSSCQVSQVYHLCYHCTVLELLFKSGLYIFLQFCQVCRCVQLWGSWWSVFSEIVCASTQAPASQGPGGDPLSESLFCTLW